MSTSEWHGILQNGEDILWQGRPDAAISMRPENIGPAIFGVFFAGFALFWMYQASRGGGMFWMFGLLHFGAGLGVALWSIFGTRFRHKRTWYTLTNRRAFIATFMPISDRRLQSFAINAQTPIDYIDGQPPSIMFATKTQRKRNRLQDVPVGFERIRDAATVQGHIRDIQQGDI